MGIIDILILIIIAFGGLIGFKQGFTRSLLSLIGYIAIIILAFILKNPLSSFLMSIGPFFDFFGLIKGLTVFNIAVYEIISFVLIFSILLIILKVLMVFTNIFEKILSLTIILGIPSKILGMILGIVKNYIIIFACLYVLALLNVSIVGNSHFAKPILTKTPILSSISGETIKVMNEFSYLKEKYKNTNSNNEFNLETLDLFLKYNVVSTDTIKKLSDSGKLKVNGTDKLLKKYERK